MKSIWGVLLVSAVLAGCGGDGGRDPVFGADGITIRAPRVTAISPVDQATGVSILAATVTATFNEPVAATGATMAVTCASPCVNPSGAVTLNASGTAATFTVTPGTSLIPLTLYSVAVTGYRSVASGLVLEAPFASQFTTGGPPDLVRPSVTFTVPATTTPATVGVATNTSIAATFSEDMATASINAASMTVTCTAPCTAPAGTVSYAASSRNAVFTPAAALAVSTTYTVTITTAATDVAGNALAGNQGVPPAASNYVWRFTTGLVADTTAPVVIATRPLANATGVPINTLVTATFSEAMNPLTVTAATFTLACPGGTSIAGIVSYASNGNVATFTPAAALPAGVTCNASISTGVRDIANNAMAAAFNWSFSTGSTADVVAPTVTSTSPAANATGVAINTLIAATFSEPMNPLTLTPATFTVACPAGVAVVGTVGVNSNVATFTPAAALPASTVCAASISTGARDNANNALAAAFNWSFTTGAAADVVAPTVTSTSPAANATGVAINSLIAATFSEPMDPLTLTPVTFTVACPAGVAVIGTVAVNSNIATFTPAASLPVSTVCTANISTGARDSANNALAAAFNWSFTTGAAADVVAPTVISTSPVANATGVATNTLIAATFSEPMDPLTLTPATFTVACPAGVAVVGTVAVNSNVATFTPAVALPASTACTANISTGARDSANNALASASSWSFTTGTVSDTTAPTVTSTTPVANETDVAIDSLIVATFSEPMDPLTLTPATFTVACPAGVPVAGTIAVNSNVATFTPTAALPVSTVCAASISTGARDIASNALATAFNWTFTTGLAPDVTPPLVSAVSPLDSATGVAPDTLIAANFSEPMDPATIGAATITLACPTGAAISGTVQYDANANAATFAPAVALPNNTQCVATVTTGVQDVAGNAMAANFGWSFRTGVVDDATAPTVTATRPVANATAVVLNTLVTADFSEAMSPATLSTASFTVACPVGTPVTGTVGYAVNSKQAVFTPDAPLPASTTCVATLSTAVADDAGNVLATAFSWSFATGVATDIVGPLVLATNPANAAIGVCTNKTINATFSEPMDPLSITTATFMVAATAGGPVSSVVAYDPTTNIASLNPVANLTGAPPTSYTVTIVGGPDGVKDVAGNPLAVDVVAVFTTNASTCTSAPALGSVASFGAFGGNSTLTNDGLNTLINGDVAVGAASSSITGLEDSGGNVYTITTDNDGLVNGLVYSLTAPPGSVAAEAVTQARTDATTAFNAISPANLPGGIDASNLAQCPSCGGALGGPDELAGRTLPPGVYLSPSGSYDIGGAGRTTADLVLDAGGDSDAVWIFQTAPGTGRLNVGLTGPATPATPIRVLLVNGAQARNVFWFVPAGAAIGTGSTMVGTMLADASITISTTGGSPPTAVQTTLNGRAIALTAGTTMTNTLINVPAR